MTGQSIIGVVGEVGASNGTCECFDLVRDKGDGLLSIDGKRSISLTGYDDYPEEQYDLHQGRNSAGHLRDR